MKKDFTRFSMTRESLPERPGSPGHSEAAAGAHDGAAAGVHDGAAAGVHRDDEGDVHHNDEAGVHRNAGGRLRNLRTAGA